MLRKKIDNILEFIIGIFVILYIVYSLVFSSKLLYDFESLVSFEKMSLYFSLVPLLLGLILKLKRKNYRRLDFLLVIFIISGLLLSYIFSIDQSISLWGRIYRSEGLVFILVYYFLYLAASEIANKKLRLSLVLSLMALVIGNAFYAILQMNEGLQYVFSIVARSKFPDATGFVGNPNFLSSLMVMGFFLSFGIYIFSEKIYSIFPMYVISIICFYGLLLAGSMSGVVSFICTFLLSILMGIIYFFIKNKDATNKILYIFKIVAIIPALCMCIFVSYKVNDSHLIKDIQKMFVDVQEGLPETAGTNRIYIWKNTLSIVPKYWITGSGIDTFKEAFGHRYLVIEDTGAYVDKAHNEYLNILVTEGIMCFVGYSCLIIYTLLLFYKRFKANRLSTLEFSLFLAFIAYLVQAFFNIRVIHIAPLFFIVWGLLNTKHKRKL